MTKTTQKAPQRPTNIKLVSESGRSRVYTATTVEPKLTFTPRVRVIKA